MEDNLDKDCCMFSHIKNANPQNADNSFLSTLPLSILAALSNSRSLDVG